jgi:hypothetical protein
MGAAPVSEKLARVEGSIMAARSLPRMFDLSDRRRPTQA